MSTNPLIAAFVGEPALVEPAMAQRFESCLNQAVAHPDYAAILAAGPDDGDYWPSSDDAWGNRVRPYVIKDSVLQIPVKGVLLHNFPYALGAWATGYDYIWRAFQRGCGDFATGLITGIALIEDTPGGMVAGCFDAVDKMVALKQQVGVPVRAFAHESAYSAGYAVATVADHIVVSRTGGVGSIGVVTSHMDVSGALQQAGIKITFIASDPSKVEGNYTEAPSKDFLDRTQARIDELYDIFVAAVSRSRGLSQDAIRGDLKAYCYTASQATSNGLADSIGSLDDALAAFCADPQADITDDGDGDDTDNDGDENMTTETTGSVAQADHDAALANARTEASTTASTAERTRISAILTSDEAKGRDGLANHLAFKTDMSVDDAKAMLAAADKKGETAEKPNGFAEAMDGSRHPNVGADVSGGGSGDPQAEAASADPVLAIVRGAGMRGFGAAAAQK